TVMAFSSGVVSCPTLRCCRSSTRLIMALSSEVKASADSCITWRNSSREPNRRPVNVRPPVQRNNRRASRLSKSTNGARPACSTFARGLPARINCRMRSRLNAKTPASMPDMKNESANDSVITTAMAGPVSTSMPILLPVRRDFDQHLAHPALVRGRGRQFQPAKDDRLPDGGHDLQLAEQQPAHRVHPWHVPQLRIFATKILQPHRRIHPPAALAQFLHDEPLRFAFAADFADDFLEDVLHRHQARRAAEFIQHDGQ